jgi:hypothetical protein
MAQHLVTAGQGDAELASALGAYLLEERRWEEALEFLAKAQEWGAAVGPGTVSRLRASVLDYAPISPGTTWGYRQADGQSLTITAGRPLGNERYAIELTVGNAAESLAWEKRAGGKVLCRYFGRDLSRCHYLPVGLTDPSPDSPLPVEEYELNGKRWIARLVSIDETVKTDGGTFDHCLLVEVSQPGSTQPVRHFFAPGVGEVFVDYPGDQGSLSRTLVSYQGVTGPQAVSRDLKSK